MKKRCEKCRKKIKSVIPIICRCEKYFCGIHKLDHDCKFDYHTEHKEKIKIKNPKVVPSKF